MGVVAIDQDAIDDGRACLLGQRGSHPAGTVAQQLGTVALKERPDVGRVVDRDAAQTVTLYRRGHTGEYELATKLPLGWLLNTSPTDHLD